MNEHMQRLFEESELARVIGALRAQPAPSLLFGKSVKPLTAEQIARLQLQGCDSADWATIYAAEGFDARTVSRTRFEGRCVLGRFSESCEIPGVLRMASGIHDATLIDCEVGNHALIRDVGLLANCVVDNGAIVSSVEEIIASPKPVFGNGVEIVLGMETGERAIRGFASLDLPLADHLIREPEDGPMRRLYESLLKQHLEAITLGKTYIGLRAAVRACRRLQDVFVGDGAVLEGANAIVNSTILSNREESTHIGDGVILRNSLIQWGCEVLSGALVENSLLTEHSHVERHGKVAHSLLGPNTGVAEGEVTSCLLGPFVGFHHQSLLIATLWPGGKGNVGYGANVGSNHTSKAPDQELWPGEGMFFGLGTNIKFPADFTSAPYTIIATGVTTLPQKVEFPFSLINSPGRSLEGVSPAFNEIMPAWVLGENLYALARNETKYRARNRARRTEIEFETLRPETMDLVREARRRLKEAAKNEPAKPGQPVFYLEKNIPGLGKNYMLENSRVEAIEAYSFALRFYALRGLDRRLLELETENGLVGDFEAVLSQPAESLNWAYELQVVQEELPGHNIRELLELWVEHHREYAENIRVSKARDDERGARIIPDYASIHIPAEKDKMVRSAAAEHAEIEKRVAGWLKT